MGALAHVMVDARHQPTRGDVHAIRVMKTASQYNTFRERNEHAKLIARESSWSYSVMLGNYKMNCVCIEFGSAETDSFFCVSFYFCQTGDK